MATRHDNGPQGEGAPETPESFTMPRSSRAGRMGRRYSISRTSRAMGSIEQMIPSDPNLSPLAATPRKTVLPPPSTISKEL